MAVVRLSDRGDGPAVVLVPSLGRGAVDFDGLAERLCEAGRRTLAVQPPARVVGTPDLLDVGDLVCDAVGDAGVTEFDLVGHAFGNRIARSVVARHADRVRSLVLLAAGGVVPPAPEVGGDLLAAFDDDMSDEDRVAAIGRAFFAEGNDPTVWRDGWSRPVQQWQGAAAQRTDRSAWWSAVPERVLVVQGLQDVVAVPENGRRLVAELGEDRAQLVEIDGAGHALLPERPDEVAAAVVGFLTGL